MNVLDRHSKRIKLIGSDDFVLQLAINDHTKQIVSH